MLKGGQKMAEINKNDAQVLAYNNFIKSPSAKTAMLFVLASGKYIGILASKWREASMNRKSKIYEIMAEMYLILLEDFCAGKAVMYNSALAYLDMKLKRLIYPSKKNVFIDIDSINTSNMATTDTFTYEKLVMVDEIVNVVRCNLFNNYDNEDGLIPFLFIHIYPKVRWISELIAAKQNTDAKVRYGADAKRIERFNTNLRKDFNNLASGDWKEVLNWSKGERSHLAWKIINISPAEIPAYEADELIALENWRENFHTDAEENITKLSCAENIFNSMNRYAPKKMAVAEEAAEWGKPVDILSMLIGNVIDDNFCVREKEMPFDDSAFDDYDPEKDPEFMECALELSQWFGNMLEKRNKKAPENRLNS